tara:strand:+ start:341 stop:586 length:246 start_codon:yes stop_codon:yes gene_type:complete
MKTLIKTDTKVSLYIFEDSETVDVQNNKVIIGDPEKLIIADCNSANVTLVEGVTNPSEWIGHKYLYDGEWKSNPDYVAPEE